MRGGEGEDKVKLYIKFYDDGKLINFEDEVGSRRGNALTATLSELNDFWDQPVDDLHTNYTYIEVDPDFLDKIELDKEHDLNVDPDFLDEHLNDPFGDVKVVFTLEPYVFANGQN